jgi:hypothetical protein
MLDGVVIDDTGLFNERLKEWEDLYNFSRGSAEVASRIR